jgi:GWxTD domain-containing protein
MLSQFLLLSTFLLFLSGNPGTPVSAKYEEGLQAKKDGNIELALKIWQEAIDNTTDPDSIDPRIGIAYIETVAENGLTSKYPKASDAYFWGIESSRIQDFKKTFDFEVERLRPLLGGKEYREFKRMVQRNDPAFSKELKKFWAQVDVNPANDFNERLLEHFYRLAELKNFGKDQWDFNTIYEKDHRAKIYLKYGEPDFKRQGRFVYNNLKIRSLIREQLSEIANPVSVNDRSSAFAREIEKNIENRCLLLHTNSMYEVWVYNNDVNFADRAVYLFESDNGGTYFEQRQSIGDFIPASAYSLSNRNMNSLQVEVFESGAQAATGDGTGAADLSNTDLIAEIGRRGRVITPAILLQLMYYEQLSAVDRIFGMAYDNMASRYYDYTTPLSMSLAMENRSTNRGEMLRMQSYMPQEKSEYEQKVNNINLDIFPYRFLNEYNKPVTLFFVRSNPFTSIITDFNLNRENYELMGKDDLQLVYTHHLLVYDEDWEMKYRLKSTPTINSQIMSRNYNVSTLFSIPFQEQENITISSELINQNREEDFIGNISSKNFDPKLIALGKVKTKHLDPISEKDFDLSDVILGYNLMSESSYEFPFYIRHDKEIPVNNNLVAYFEIYNTALSEQSGNSEITIEYEILTKRPRLIGAIFGKTKTNTTLKINKQGNDKIYKELIEIESEKFKTGNYILRITVTDKVTGEKSTREVDFSVSD